MSRRGPAVRWSDGTFAEDSEEYDEEDGLSEGEVAVFDESEVVDLVRERANAAAKTKGPAPTLGDEALARALASQRSERLSVAQRRLLESDPTDRPAADGAEQSLGMARGQLGQASAGSSREGSASGVGASRKRPARAAEAAETGAAGKRRAPSRAAEPERRRPRDPWVEEEGNGDATGRGWSGDEGAGGSGAGASEETGEEEEEEEEGVDDGEELVAGLTVPRQLWKKLFEHQRTCLEWLWELHQQEVGGILGDEMGLGKTLQMIALWACLQASGRGGPCLVVCPATVLLQWKREVQRWAPEIETVEVLHHSQGGAEPGNRLALLRSVCSDRSPGSASVLVTSYEMVRSHAGQLLSMPWQYVVLDEGHKIRNPHAEITQVCKQFNTPHRLILSGAPIQNKLTELWSLFDFVFPGKLGTLPLFEEHFAIPIAMGTYANASEFKVQTAARCSMVLRDLLRPYLLRRMKADVKLAMPDKSEKVLFCRLTESQREAYELYLSSSHVEKVLAGAAHAFAALTTILKICNHPHLHTWDAQDRQAAAAVEVAGPASAGIRYGDWRLSGKLRVLHSMLRPWHRRGDRVLIFCQTRQMLDIVQKYVQEQNYTHVRLDGNTSVASRLNLIDRFNANESIFIFLLTTRAGGLGINLTGANRVVLLDPDWNPANDLQARERAWRVGQKRSVAVFRLVTGGTLEEKVYQRQIFKTVLSNRVLTENSVKNKTLKRSDLRDLLAPPSDAGVGDALGDAQAAAESAGEAGGAGGGASGSGGAGPGGGGSSSVGRELIGSRVSGSQKLEETSLLEGLLRGDLLSSTLDHEREVESGKGRDSSIASVEARRVAERAAAALRDSSESCARAAAGVRVPTWTGRNDGAGGPQHRFGTALSKAVAGLSGVPAAAGNEGSFFAAGHGCSAAIGSSALLQRVRQRETAAASSAGAPQDAGETTEADAMAAGLLRDISAFFRSHGGTVNTSQLVGRFRACAEPHLFKQLLRQVAKQQGKMWVLDSRFS